MVINHNMSAMFAQRQGGITELNHTKNLEKLSSGEKINRAGDDASGLAVSEKMRAQIRGLNKASENAQNDIRESASWLFSLQTVSTLTKIECRSRLRFLLSLLRLTESLLTHSSTE